MQLNIITPEKLVFSDTITMVGIPGTLGDFGVLEGHAPFISTIRPGVITIDSTDGTSLKLCIMGGIAEVTPSTCIILAETIVDCAKITADFAQEKAEQAAEDYAAANSESAKKQADIKQQFAQILRQNIA
jgi:F-type H+-transporting ATPase subunit epsilon